VLVPYAAYKLVRILRLFELPGDGWSGWHMHSGRLWSPEGYGFSPGDSDWWGLLVRRAEGFGRTFERAQQLDLALQRLRQTVQVGSAADVATLTPTTATAGVDGSGDTGPKKGRESVTRTFFPRSRTFLQVSRKQTCFAGVGL